ncbi:AMP-binding protein [Microbacterium sp. BWT-B31]|uniref:class I adenylate-forming enzyme family protein n=1 Tax=Microbacterium sp. BWT-B31 TaxID=3232072 RepID=UPI00352789F4
MTTHDEPHTIGRWLIDRAAQSPGRIAIDDRGVTLTYDELARRSATLADRLRQAGYGAGHRIATVSGNSSDHVVAFFACALAGVAFVPLSWRLTPVELAHMLVRSAPALVLVEDEYATLAAEALRAVTDGADTSPSGAHDPDAASAAAGTAVPPTAALGTTGIEGGPTRPDSPGGAAAPFGVGVGTVPVAPDPRPAAPVRDDDPLLVIFTSGSEAAPKGVVLTHANCFWNNLAFAQALPLAQHDVVLAMLPQFHIAAWNCQPLLAWWTGATVVLERSFQPTRVLQLIRERRVTAMMGVPTQYALLAADREWASSDLSSLRMALVGGATMPAALHDEWGARGVALTQGYGLTEAGPNVLHLAAADAPAHAGAVGRPYPGVVVRVVDSDTLLPLEGEATGELWVRGPSVFAGYLGDPAATERAMHDGWLRTGDIVHRDADGILRVVDRLKDIIISGGENVAPAEVEAALLRHPLVEAAAVVGVADPVWGERGVAFVVRADGAALSADEVLAHARRNLAAFKVPVRIEFLAELPRSAIDKLARGQLRAQARLLMSGSAGSSAASAASAGPAAPAAAERSTR